MTEDKKENFNEPISKITIDPTEGVFGFQFPEGATEAEKRLMFLEVERAKITGKPVEIDSRVKVVPLFKPKSETSNVSTTPKLASLTPVPVPKSETPSVPTPTPVPTPAPTETPPAAEVSKPAEPAK